MLVLSRKPNEQLIIGDGITITVLGVRGSAIRIGIEAPPEVAIRRAEVAPLPHTPRPPRPSRPRPRRDSGAGSSGSGEPALAVVSRPLAMKLLARRVPSVRTSSLIS